MKKLLKSLAALSMAALFFSCDAPDANRPEFDGERPGVGISTGSGGGSNSGPSSPGTPNEVVNVSGSIGLSSDTPAPDFLEECVITTITGQSDLSDGGFNIEATSNSHAQTFFISDSEENVYMLSRTTASRGNDVVIDVHSTVLALVTLHPLFAPLAGDDYEALVSMIIESPCYEELYNQVLNSINSQTDLFSTENDALLIALSNMIEDLCVDIDEEDYSGSLDDLVTPTRSTTQRRAIYENPKIYPLYAEINGNVLTLRNTGLTPSYFGTVTKNDGSAQNIAVKAREDYGGFDLFQAMDEINLGPECNYTFASAGEYRFHLSRTNEAATADFYLRLANCILSALGLELGSDAIQEIGNSIFRAMINAGSGVNDAAIDPMEWVGIAYSATLEQLETGTFLNAGVVDAVVNTGKFLLKSLNIYNKIKGSANAALRISYAITAPTELRFCLCYYQGEVSTCTTVTLLKGDGDGQNGYPKQRLLTPLTVYVAAYDEDGYPVQPGNYHRVKFEVVSGGGSVSNEYTSVDQNYQAATYWTLGEEGEQTVRAVVVDMITDAEISEPVYFNANMGNADITVRLDWHKLSFNTDIDLHMYDPFGEHIYYGHMTSASGGWLDRDDVVGPGPEHIRWENAPAGTYEIYVHFYGPNCEDITSYTVTATVNGTTYQPVTGSIAYNQMIPIGTFTIGDGETSYNSVARSSYMKQLGTIQDVVEFWNLPEKN